MKTKIQISKINVGLGRLVADRDSEIESLAGRVHGIVRQIGKRERELARLKSMLSPLVRIGTTTCGKFKIQKNRVKGHHVKPYFCKAYETLSVQKL